MSTPEPKSRVASSTALGTASELQAAASLIRLGLQVARPVVDGDGVDLVFYGSGRSVTLQVRSSAFHEIADGHRWHVFPTARLQRFGGPDFLLFHGRGVDEAW